MNKRKKIMIIVVGVQVLILLGIYIYLKNPIFSYYADSNCKDELYTSGGSAIKLDCKLYSIGFYQNHTGVHFLSKEKYKKIMAVYDKLKEKLKNYKPLDDIHCKGVISLDGIKYEIPGYICHYYDCEYSLYDEETGLLITEIYSYLSD